MKYSIDPTIEFAQKIIKNQIYWYAIPKIFKDFFKYVQEHDMPELNLAFINSQISVDKPHVLHTHSKDRSIQTYQIGYFNFHKFCVGDCQVIQVFNTELAIIKFEAKIIFRAEIETITPYEMLKYPNAKIIEIPETMIHEMLQEAKKKGFARILDGKAK
ncbi:MAG: hypothetical protein ACXQS8_09415 [Candidatus Helarchaeales archaeon]